MEEEIRHWFRCFGQDFDNYTVAAEYCADELGHDEWLDDSDHVLWDVAVDYYEN